MSVASKEEVSVIHPTDKAVSKAIPQGKKKVAPQRAPRITWETKDEKRPAGAIRHTYRITRAPGTQ